MTVIQTKMLVTIIKKEFVPKNIVQILFGLIYLSFKKLEVQFFL
jgi:hypothetical protein